MSDQTKNVKMILKFNYKSGCEETVTIFGRLCDCKKEANNLLQIRGGKENMISYSGEHFCIGDIL